MKLLNQLIIGLLILSTVTISAKAAFLCDGVNDYFYLADNSLTTFPDGDWTLYLKIKPTSNTGTSQNRFFAVDSAIGFIELNAMEASATNANKLEVNPVDDDGTDLTFFSSTTPFSSTNWMTIIIQRSGDTVTAYINGSSVGSATNASFDGMDGTSPVVFCTRHDFTTNKEFPGAIAEPAFWTRALSTKELAALSADASPDCFQDSLKWHIRAIRDYNEIRAGIAVTNGASTAATTQTAHPRMIYCF